MDESVDDGHGGFDGPFYLPLRAEGVSDGVLGDALGAVNVYETSKGMDGSVPLIGVVPSTSAVSYHRFRRKGGIDGKASTEIEEPRDRLESLQHHFDADALWKLGHSRSDGTGFRN